jgi:hypothetical protein
MYVCVINYFLPLIDSGPDVKDSITCYRLFKRRHFFLCEMLMTSGPWHKQRICVSWGLHREMISVTKCYVLRCVCFNALPRPKFVSGIQQNHMHTAVLRLGATRCHWALSSRECNKSLSSFTNHHQRLYGPVWALVTSQTFYDSPLSNFLLLSHVAEWGLRLMFHLDSPL